MKRIEFKPQRRQLLKWTTPVVTMVALPAHAQTSPGPMPDPDPMPDLVVTKSQSGGPSPATTRGDVIEYTIILENTGDTTLTNVMVVDTLPDGSDATLSAVSETLTDDGVLEAGETWTYTTTYTVTQDDLIDGGDLVNTVTVSVDELADEFVDTEETPVTQVCSCSGPPVLMVSASPKCSGNPPIGSAEIDIFAADDCGVILKDLSVTTDDAKSDLGGFPLFPIEISDTSPESINWMGPASDGVTCLPLASISLTIEYCCVGDPETILEETYDITQLLLDSTS